MTIDKRIAIGILCLFLAAGGAFLFEQAIKAQGSRSGKLVPVVQHNKTIAYLDAGVIRQLHEQERELGHGRDNSGGDNEVSLGFVLGSAGVVDYQYILVSGAVDSEYFKLNPREVGDMLLSANGNGTLTMADRTGGNRILLKVVAKIQVAD